ncbi:MAG: alcohol dehydrogenase catalytic domain-containing protein [Lachnospiraceae bacterium]|nr:alcohol dehydrogenase catalytic domain-containing protein [Lachnospiraceae bacterium]
MKALRYLGPEKLEVQEVPVPEPGKGEVLVKVKGCGICGSDVHGYYGLTGRRIPPMTMGHEFSGEIAGLGQGAEKFKVGDRVIVQPIDFCGSCENCQKGMTMLCLNKRFFGVLTTDGAMAEYVAVPEKLLYPVPENSDCYIGALAEPYAVAYGAVEKAGDLEGKNVLIIGAGMIGACVLQLAKLKNPAKLIVSDLSDARLKTALELGADAVINPKNEDYMEALSRLTDGAMIDTSIECVGVQASANQAIKCLKVGGTAVWVGMSQKEMTINMQDVVCSARRVLGSFNYTHEEFGQVAKIVTSGRLATDKLITKVVSLEEAVEVFPDIHNRPDDYLKVIIDPTL